MRDQKIIMFFEKLFVVLVLKRTSKEINSFIQWLRRLFNGQWPLIRYKTEVLPSESNAQMYILLFAAFPAVLIVDFSRASANVELFVLHTQPNTEYLLCKLLLYYYCLWCILVLSYLISFIFMLFVCRWFHVNISPCMSLEDVKTLGWSSKAKTYLRLIKHVRQRRKPPVLL